MDREYWRERWRDGRTGFHQLEIDAHLARHFPPLLEKVGALEGVPRVLVPLCGKSLDLSWLAAQGTHVTGVEIAPEACTACAAEQGLVAVGPGEWSSVGSGTSAAGAGRLDLHELDIFDLPLHAPGREADGWDLVWDRAALIALPPDVRTRYAAHVLERVRPGGAILLITAEYPTDQMQGPPFSVLGDEVERLFGDCAITELDRIVGTREMERFGVSEFRQVVRKIEIPAT